MYGLPDCIQRLQIVASFAVGDRFGHVRHTLRSLAKRDDGDHAILHGVDGSSSVVVLEPDVESRPIAGRPETMRQCACGNGRYLLERIGAENLYHVKSANRDV